MADNMLVLSTDDSKDYKFYPVWSASFEFEVKTHNDAHVFLTKEPQETEPYIQIVIGGWDNTESVIRKNKINKAIVTTPGILDANEFRGFWIHWDGGLIQIGREEETKSFLSWEDPDPFRMTYVGVCSKHGATGIWRIEDMLEFTTTDNSPFIFQPVVAGSVKFEYRGPHNCHVALTSGPAEEDPMYEILLGCIQNTKSSIRYCREKPDKVTVATPGLLDPNHYKKFLIEWRNRKVVVRDGDSSKFIMEWVDTISTTFVVSHFGVLTKCGQWRIPHFYNPNIKPTHGKWVDASYGVVPPGAVVGGYENEGERLYVARAHHEGSLITGKLVPSLGAAFIPWNGREILKYEYQVLVGDSTESSDPEEKKKDPEKEDNRKNSDPEEKKKDPETDDKRKESNPEEKKKDPETDDKRKESNPEEKKKDPEREDKRRDSDPEDKRRNSDQEKKRKECEAKCAQDFGETS